MGFLGGEVADAGADVEGEGTGVGQAVEGERLSGVVGYLDADSDAREVGQDVFAGGGEGGFGDINGLVDDASLLADCLGEEEAGFGGGAGAQLDESEHGSGSSVAGGSGFAEDLRGVEGEDAALGAGEIVLGQFGDLLEEVGTSFVVEEPWGEGFGVYGETGAGRLCDMKGGCIRNA